jgi:hypothetical protein
MTFFPFPLSLAAARTTSKNLKKEKKEPSLFHPLFFALDS